MTEENVLPGEISPDLILSFQKVFTDFQTRAEKLSTAYEAMQGDFKKINIELDQKNNELQLSLERQESMQSYLDSILQSMENGVIGVDITGSITHFNRAAIETIGYSAEEVLHKRYADFFSTKEGVEPELIRVLNQGSELRRNERVIWHKDGHPVPVSYQHALLRDQSGRRLGAVEIFSDVSKIKALEEEMQQTKTMAALGEMSATVAHEIRNPLGAMGMWAALLERDFSADDPRRNTLGKIVEGLSRLNKIVSNLLVFTRPVKAEFRKVDLKKVIIEIVDFVQIEIERMEQTVTVEHDWQPDESFVLADPEKIGQVVLNLCLNAVQAMPAGGTLRVGVESGGHGDNEYVVFSVCDTGTGIDKEELRKIFDPFYTTKENGTGLGLAIVKKYIEHHAGYIDVSSEKKRGTTVKVFIPKLKE